MFVSRQILGRNLRLVLLLIMLASQAIANTHELGAEHDLGSQACSSCLIGNGLGAAIAVIPEDLQLEPGFIHAPVQATEFIRFSRTNGYSSRAPPESSYIR